MQVDGYTFMADAVAKFHGSVYVTGWFHHAEDSLVEVALTGGGIIAQVSQAGLTHLSVEPEAEPGRGFRLQCLRDEHAFADDLAVAFVTRFGRQLRANLLELSAERLAQSTSARLYHRFRDRVAAIRHPRVVDLGGRNHGNVDRAVDFPGSEYIVADILPGENVDLVADAHALSNHIAPESVDAVISVATFEHLLMPWKAAVEINRILKPGGIACLISHQTLGLHEMPWDFWRLSADAWDGLLNHYTGFEIVERAMAQDQFIIPFYYRPELAIAEQSAGFEFSGVIARKTGPALVDWPVPLDQVIATAYPTGPASAAPVPRRRGRRRATSRPPSP